MYEDFFEVRWEVCLFLFYFMLFEHSGKCKPSPQTLQLFYVSENLMFSDKHYSGALVFIFKDAEVPTQY